MFMTFNPYYDLGITKYLALQTLEIEEHKYLLSEKIGHDIGYNHAALDYIDKGYAKSFRAHFEEHHVELENISDSDLEKIIIEHNTKKLHKILKN